MSQGRWFRQENPLAVFWLKASGLVAEVQSRPRGVSLHQAALRAPLWLRLTSLVDGGGNSRRVAIWPPHTMARSDPGAEADAALAMLVRTQRFASQDQLRNGLILLPAHGEGGLETRTSGSCSATAVSIDSAGPQLANGLQAIGRHIADSISLEAA